MEQSYHIHQLRDLMPAESNHTREVIAKLVLEESIQSRENTVVLAAFNVAAALVIILSIVYDAYRVWKRDYGFNLGSKLECLQKIHPAEVFPLILSTTIFLQGIIFIIVQAMGLSSIWVTNCKAITQIVWPTVWLFAEVLLVFGIEVAVRSLKRNRFGPRGRWNSLICWSTVIVLLLLTWIPSKVRPVRSDACLGSLVFFAVFWSDFGVVINTVILVVYAVTGSIIAYKLYKTVKMDREERIAASRMVYYLGVGFLLMASVLPFWVNNVERDFLNMAPFRIATVALNLFGLINLLLHLILRSNSENLAIRPRQAAWAKRREWRIFGSADLDLASQIERPITLEPTSNSNRFTVGDEKRPIPGLLSPYHEYRPQGNKSIGNEPTLPSQTLQVPSTAARHSRKPSNYSLFPVRGARRTSSVYDDDDGVLAPPRPLFFRRHKRDSSELSSATVQIGLRLSHAALAAVGSGPAVSPSGQTSHTRQASHPLANVTTASRPSLPEHLASDNSLHLPIQRPVQRSGRLVTANHTPQDSLDKSNTNGRTQTINFQLDINPDLPIRKDSLNRQGRSPENWQRERDARFKTLPPIPSSPPKATTTTTNNAIPGSGPDPQQWFLFSPQQQARRMSIRPSSKVPDEEKALPSSAKARPITFIDDEVDDDDEQEDDDNKDQDERTPQEWPLRAASQDSIMLLPSRAYRPPTDSAGEQRDWI